MASDCKKKYLKSSAAVTNDNVKKSPSLYSMLCMDMPTAYTKYSYSLKNINRRVADLPAPHIRLPKDGLTAVKTAVKVYKGLNTMNRVSMPVALTVDVLQTGLSMHHDRKHGTTRNTVEQTVTVAGGWGGGYGGCVGGAALGTVLFPGAGTIVGGIFGAIGGSIVGSFGASYIVDNVGDAYSYDLIEKTCTHCGKTFKVRKYLGEKDKAACPDCEKKDEVKKG